MATANICSEGSGNVHRWFSKNDFFKCDLEDIFEGTVNMKSENVMNMID